MSGGGEVLVGLVIAVGLAGVVIQVLPGSLLVLGAIGGWALWTSGVLAWSVFAGAALAIGAAGVAKYILANRHMKRADVPTSTMWWGGLAGVVGFFLLPVVGLPLGFVLGVFLAELIRRRDHHHAWRATVAALKATGITILVELAGALVAAGLWVVAVVFG